MTKDLILIRLLGNAAEAAEPELSTLDAESLPRGTFLLMQKEWRCCVRRLARANMLRCLAPASEFSGGPQEIKFVFAASALSTGSSTLQCQSAPKENLLWIFQDTSGLSAWSWRRGTSFVFACETFLTYVMF